ncbi:hypothetical protein PGRAN_07943 [Listeria grandensis FSL F6-0971]|uniref:RsbT co-antagonist protein RsbRD N-terminal domain-containing protein n=1 Tax=Listeria grandensis FSL F6-0971 TaxID=1265819 RepID=W7BFH4_9LIST|nr:hypothetical protein [Listeria grandensis]EUJ23575.1 hypothetical protein PGRAN_07943 [Listeria grandensis FSL F6-0971]
MSTTMRFLKDHVEEATDYWISSYYVNSEEYQLRKYTPGYLAAHRKETLHLFKQALTNWQDAVNVKEIGEDRYDMRTSLIDAFMNHMSFYTAIHEFLIIHYMKHTFFCSEKELFEDLLKIREYEVASAQALITGYMSKQEID